MNLLRTSHKNSSSSLLQTFNLASTLSLCKSSVISFETDFNMATIDSEQHDIIREINTVLPELDSEKLYYINNIARMFANKD